MASRAPVNANILYLYDLPADSVSSTALAKKLQEEGIQIDLTRKPQIHRRLNTEKYNAMVALDEKQSADEAEAKMRVFDFGNAQCRAKKRDERLLGKNKEALKNKNVFFDNYQEIDEKCDQKNFLDMCEKHGKVLVHKLIWIKDNTDKSKIRKCYAYVTFETEEQAQKFIEANKEHA